MRALVTDVHIRSAVFGLRALGRSGVEVTALGHGRLAAGMLSVHAARRVVAPDVLDDPDAFLAAIVREAAEHGPVVVYPGWEEALETLTAAWAALPSEVILPYASAASVHAVRDKARLPELARAAGLPTVPQLAAGTAGELLGADFSYPCVIKSAAAVGAVAWPRRVSSRAEAHAMLSALPASQPLIVQDAMAPEKTSVSLVLDRDGGVAAAFQHETSRSWPASAGSTALAVGVAPDRDLIERVAELLRQAGFWGLAEVELIGTPDGLAPIDVNPRFYGTLSLALASGVNLPLAWHRVATGEPAPPLGPYRTGVTFRWLEADVSGALQGHRGLLRDGGSRPRVGAMWSRDDVASSAALAVAAYTSRARRVLARRRDPQSASSG